MTATTDTTRRSHECTDGVTAERIVRNTDKRVTTRSTQTVTGTVLVYVVEGHEFESIASLAEYLT